MTPGWPYSIKRYHCRISFFPKDGRLPVVKCIVKHSCLEFAEKLAVKIAKSYFRDDKAVRDANYEVSTIWLREVNRGIPCGRRVFLHLHRGGQDERQRTPYNHREA